MVDLNNTQNIQNKKINFRDFGNSEHWEPHDRNIKNYIPFEVIEICKKLFEKFSKGHETVPADDLLNMLRLMNLNPTKQEVDDMLINLNQASLDPKKKKESFDLSEFLVCVARKRRDSSNVDELLMAFKILDKNNTGKLSEPVLRYMLCNKGEIFDETEMNAFMKEATPQFIEKIDDINYLNYNDYALYLRDKWNPPEVDDPKKDKKKEKK